MSARTAIIIVNYHTPWHLDKCLESVFACTEDFHIYLVHNQPDRQSLQVGEKYKAARPGQISISQNEKNVGFVDGVNTPFSEAIQHERICLLNSDTIVTPGWLSQLNKEMDEVPTIAQICPDSNSFYSDKFFWRLVRNLPGKLNRLQIWQQKLGKAPRAGNNEPFAPAGYFFDFCGGFCTLFRSEHMQGLGYILDPKIVHGYWDDLDLSCHLRQYGDIGSTRKAYVFHFLGTSFKMLSKGNQSKNYHKQMVQRINGLYVMHKWREYFRSNIDQEDTSQLVGDLGNPYLQAIVQYFGVASLKPKLQEYLETAPARQYWEEVTK